MHRLYCIFIRQSILHIHVQMHMLFLYISFALVAFQSVFAWIQRQNKAAQVHLLPWNGTPELPEICRNYRFKASQFSTSTSTILSPHLHIHKCEKKHLCFPILVVSAHHPVSQPSSFVFHRKCNASPTQCATETTYLQAFAHHAFPTVTMQESMRMLQAQMLWGHRWGKG